MTGVAGGTDRKLLRDVGMACADYQDRVLQDLKCKRIQCDEIWQFCYAKEKNVPAEKKGQFGYGDVWTWTAINAVKQASGSRFHAWQKGFTLSHDVC